MNPAAGSCHQGQGAPARIIRICYSDTIFLRMLPTHTVLLSFDWCVASLSAINLGEKLGNELDNECWTKEPLEADFASWLIIHSWLPNACSRLSFEPFLFQVKLCVFSFLSSPFLLHLSTASQSLSFFIQEWIGCLSLEESGTQLSCSGLLKVLAIQTRWLVGMRPWLPWSSWQGTILQVSHFPHQHPTWASLTCSERAFVDGFHVHQLQHGLLRT